LANHQDTVTTLTRLAESLGLIGNFRYRHLPEVS